MEITLQSMVEAVDHLNHRGIVPLSVTAFLKRPAALDFMEEYLHETDKSTEEAILLLLSAIRFIDNKGGYDADVPTVLEAPEGAVNLDLFLVRHHAELYHLCRTRRVQTNLAERALPVLDLLAKRYHSRPLALIELGCSYGLIGRVACAVAAVEPGFAEWFEPGQQKPRAWPQVTVYRGIDMAPPDTNWLLASIPFASVRSRAARFVRELAPLTDWLVCRGSAMELGEHPAIRELLPRFVAGHPDQVLPVLLTSFFLSRLKDIKRQPIIRAVRQFAAAQGGVWINQDYEAVGHPRCIVSLDGEPKLTLDSEFCRSWSSWGTGELT